MADTAEAAESVAAAAAEGEADDKRERSTIRFPYGDLDDAQEIAQGVQHWGLACGIDQLAAQLQQTVSSGAFRMKLATASTMIRNAITSDNCSKLMCRSAIFFQMASARSPPGCRSSPTSCASSCTHCRSGPRSTSRSRSSSSSSSTRSSRSLGQHN